jgi:hypothetical protein
VNSNGQLVFPDNGASSTRELVFGNQGANDWAIEKWDGGLNFWKLNGTNSGDNKLFINRFGTVGINSKGLSQYQLLVQGRTGINGDLTISSANPDWVTALRVNVNAEHSVAYTITRGGRDYFYVRGDGRVFSEAGYYRISDGKLKKDVEQVNNALSNIMKLRGVQYSLIDTYGIDSLGNVSFSYSPATVSKSNGNTDKAKQGNNQHKKQIGFIAQELELIYPDAVTTINDGLKAVDYSALVPILIEAIKEQQAQIVALQIQAASPTSLASRVQAIEKQLSQCCKVQPGNGKLKSDIISETGKETQDVLETSAIVLHQNSPNPFSQSTAIQMEIPIEVNDASLTVYNLAGEQKLSIAVNERGLTSVRIEAGKLNPGIYIYGIVADGELAASRQMVVTE